MADDGPALALQGALVAALKADAGIAALVAARVYDEPPQSVVLPYVRIGEIIVQPFRTDGRDAFDVTFGIEAYSRPLAGRVECAQIANAIMVALHDCALTITGYSLAWMLCETSSTSRAPDGLSYSSAVAFTAMLDVSA